MNYATLFETIKGYVENDFPNTSWTNSAGTGTVTLTSTEQINTFIQQAELRINNTVQLLIQRKNATINCITGNPYVAAPADWLATFSMAVITPSGNYEFLLNKDVSYIRSSSPNPATLGTPTHYANFDDNTFLMGPTPDINYSVDINYFFYPPSIVTAGTSWLGDNFDAALLYGALLEAYTFMKGEPDIIAGYQKRYDDSIIMLKELGEGKNRQDTYRDTQVRYPVR
jgi:hypothetical protein